MKNVGERLRRLYRPIRRFTAKHKRTLLIGLLVLMVAQLLYPRGWAQPTTFSNGKYLGFSTTAKAKSYYQSLVDKKIVIKIESEAIEAKPADIGFEVSESTIRQHVTNYPFWQRLIPFSLLMPRSVSTSDWQSFNKGKLAAFSEEAANKYTIAPVNAGAAKNEQGDFVLSGAKPGRGVTKGQVESSLRSLELEKHHEVSLSPTKIDPIIKDEMIRAVLDKTKSENIKPITFSVAEKKYDLTAAIIKPWLTIEINEAERRVQLGFDQPAMEEWFARNIAVVNSGKPTIVTYRDGAEVSKVEGIAGRGVDKTKAVPAIKQAIQDGQTQVTGEVVNLPITVQTLRTYSPTNAGLNVMIDDWLKEYPKMQGAVYLREISGRGLSAERNADSQMFVASVAKLFIAHYVLENISDLNQIAYDNRTYAACIEAMIKVSDNTCPERIRDKHTAGAINGFAASNGFGRVNVNGYIATARDIGKYLERLNSGSLMSGDKAELVLAPMRSQIYRAGIPAGSPGASVADKPGFYGDTWTDGAIVRSNGSTYVLVILTKSGGSVAVKTLAQRVQQTLNQ